MSNNNNQITEYPKIETLFVRDEQTHKVDATQIRNPIYSIIKTWQFTEKIDGTNIRVIFSNDPESGSVGPEFRGRTDRASLHPELIKHLQETITPQKLEEVFNSKCEVVIYGEGYGAGIQSGGNYSDTKKFIVFDIKINGYWLAWEHVVAICKQLNIDSVPYIGEMTLEEATKMVKAGFPSMLNGGKQPSEGLVGNTVEPLFDKKGDRLIIKVKTKDF